MVIWTLMLSFLISAANAGIGKIIKMDGDGAHLIRKNSKMALSLNADLEEGDQIFSNNSHLVLLLAPASQFSLPKQGQLNLTKMSVMETAQGVKVSSSVELVKGLVRVLVLKEKNQEIEQAVTSTLIEFKVKGTEFEVGVFDDGADLDVVQGEVEASSPLIHTFVPEIVKTGEGLRFDRKRKNYVRRKSNQKIKRPGFLGKEEVKSRWAQKTKV